jgi:hypothetical protein
LCIPPSTTSLHENDLHNESEADEIVEEIIDYNWDENEISVNSLKIMYDYFGEFDKRMFTAHQNQQLSYKGAVGGPDAAKWQAAIRKELDAISRHEVWDIVPRPKDKQVIPMKWVFRIKQDGTYKARLVEVGCRDKEKYSKISTASPTPSAASIRWFWSIVSLNGWDSTLIDIINAYLHGFIDREKFVSIPQGIDTNSKKFACKLKKALYGLATAPICFIEPLTRFSNPLDLLDKLVNPAFILKIVGKQLLYY